MGWRTQSRGMSVTVLILAALLFAFQNCSQVAFDSSRSESSKSSGTSDDTSKNGGNDGDATVVLLPPPPTVDQAIKNCMDASIQNRLVTTDQIVLFEDTKVETGRTQVCEFGKGDNLDIKDGELRARYEQIRALNLPTNAIICDIEMATPLQKFRYDDIFFLTFNNRILATNSKSEMFMRLAPEFSVRLSNNKDVLVYQYEWLKMRTAPFSNVANDYCLGKDESGLRCEWPITEQSGNLIFAFSPELLIAIGLKGTATNQKFGFIITGDNDRDIDCYHEKLSFTMKVKYYLAN